MARIRPAAWVAVALSVTPAWAHAQATEPAAPALSPSPAGQASGTAPAPAASESDPSLVEARTLYGEGVTLFRQRRFAEAVIAFERAYSLRPHPVTLYNAAEARFRAGDRTHALDQLRDLLAMTDPAPDAQLVERARTLAREAGVVELLPSPPEAAACPPCPTCPAPRPCPTCPPPQIIETPIHWATPTLLASGAVLLAVGGGFNGAATANSMLYAHPSTPLDLQIEVRDRGTAFRAVGLVGLILGLGAEGVGLWWAIRPPAFLRAPRPATSQQAPGIRSFAFGPDGAAIGGVF